MLKLDVPEILQDNRGTQRLVQALQALAEHGVAASQANHAAYTQLAAEHAAQGRRTAAALKKLDNLLFMLENIEKQSATSSPLDKAA